MFLYIINPLSSDIGVLFGKRSLSIVSVSSCLFFHCSFHCLSFYGIYLNSDCAWLFFHIWDWDTDLLFLTLRTQEGLRFLCWPTYLTGRLQTDRTCKTFAFDKFTFLLKKKKNLFVYLFILAAGILVAALGIFSCGMQTLRCSMWDLVPWPGVKPSHPALEHIFWITRPPGKSQIGPIF